MDLFPVYGTNFKLDGGAAFGVVPKVLWEMFYRPDKDNLIDVSSRCLLVKTSERLILIDTGLGNKQDEKFFGNFHLSGNPDLSLSFQECGFSYDDVTDIIFTHLHYDHCGGAVVYNEEGKPVPVFKNAMHWCSHAQWEWAMNPNSREVASFLKENFVPLFEQEKMKFIDHEMEFIPGIFLKIVNGHTEGQVIPMIQYKNRTLVFMADFIPSTGHIPLAWVPAFDVRPLITLKEKEEFLIKAAEENYILFFEHDYHHECCTVQQTKKGIRVKEIFKFQEI